MKNDSLLIRNLTKVLPAGYPYLTQLALLILIFIVAAGVKPAAGAFPAENETRKLSKHILVMTGQPYLTDWFDTLNHSLREKLLSGLSSDSKISYEYIGSESLKDPEYDVKLMDMFRVKYAHIRQDMVIAVMPISCQFILDHGEAAFPQTASIFVLPSKQQLAKIYARPGSGVVKSPSDAIPGTIERIRMLFPDTERLVVAGGSGPDDIHYQKAAEEAVKNKGWPKTVEYLQGLPAEDLAARLERLEAHSAVLLLTYIQDRQGQPLTTVQVIKAVSNRSAAPIFSFYDTVMGLGVVGGKLTNAEGYGKATAEAAIQMFTAGKETPFVEKVAEARDIYDARQMEKWKISKDRLPEGSEIRFRRVSFWQEHILAIVLGLALIMAETLLILALLFNLARRRRAEQAHNASEKKYRDIFDNAIMGIFQSTPGGRFLNVNPAFTKLFGYETPQKLLQDIHDIQKDVYVNPEDRVRFKNLFEQEGCVKGFQAQYKRRDGSRFWISIAATAIRDQAGNILYYEGTIEDITQQKQAEMELEKHRSRLEELVRERTAELEVAKVKAESADRLKSAFLATMSHELRTPLNSIIGFTGILLQRLVGSLNEEQDKQLNMVYASAKHLLDLINDVLDISKIEAEQLHVAMEDFDVKASVEKVVKSSLPLADKKGLELAADIAPNVGVIHSDRRRVEQILLNLLSNAIKFTERGSVRVTCEIRDGKLIAAVKDSGIGIKPEDMGLLFNAFQQIESGITRKYEGTGLGLSICKKLAYLLGGEILVESEWGKGSTFSLVLPEEGEII